MICIDKNKVEFSMDKNSIPVAYADSGSEVTFACRDCYHDQILSDRFEFEKINMKLNNPATGPLYINGATPGDMLKVFIKKIDISNSGVMCVRTGSGIYEIEGCHCRQFDIKDRNIIFDNNILIPIAPMVGVIGTAPKDEPISTQCPGEHGGNLDIKDLGEGAVLFLPVNVEGGLLYMGDIHAVQGDGETAICALEVGGKVTVKVDVIKKNRRDSGSFYNNRKKLYNNCGINYSGRKFCNRI